MTETLATFSSAKKRTPSSSPTPAADAPLAQGRDPRRRRT